METEWEMDEGRRRKVEGGNKMRGRRGKCG